MEELELTYLVKELPVDLFSFPSKELVDIYLPEEAGHPILRIRKAGEKYEITKKELIVDGDASRQRETTIPLTTQEYEALQVIAGKRVYKTRYYYQENNILHEIDVFRGDLSGLVLADVEFASVEEKAKFTMPTWCLADVTQESFIAGGMICGKKYTDIAEKLARFNYSKLEI